MVVHRCVFVSEPCGRDLDRLHAVEVVLHRYLDRVGLILLDHHARDHVTAASVDVLEREPLRESVRERLELLLCAVHDEIVRHLRDEERDAAIVVLLDEQLVDYFEGDQPVYRGHLVLDTAQPLPACFNDSVRQAQ